LDLRVDTRAVHACVQDGGLPLDCIMNSRLGMCWGVHCVLPARCIAYAPVPTDMRALTNATANTTSTQL
jgi:hypothetical protein